MPGPVDFLFVMELFSLDAYINRLSTEQTNKAFSFFEFSLLRQALEGLDVSFGITYLVRGIPVDPESIRPWTDLSRPDGRKWLRAQSFATYPGRGDAVSKCYQFLMNDFSRMAPKNIVLCGNTVKEIFFPDERRPITKLLHETKSFYTIPVRFLASPQMVIRNPTYQESWFSQVKQLVTGKEDFKDKEANPAVILSTLDEVRSFVAMLKNHAGPVSVDIETDNLKKRYGNRIATLQFSIDDTTGYVIPYQHFESPFSPEELQEIKALLYDLFKNPSAITNWVGHNLKFECNIIRQVIGSALWSAPIFDTMVAAFLIDENRSERMSDFKYGVYTLKQLVYDYCNFDGYDKGVLASRDDGNLSALPLRTLADYGAVDTIVTYRLRDALIKEARRQKYLRQLNGLMFGLYSPMILMFSDIEFNGLPVNKEYLRVLISRNSPLLKEINDIQLRLRDTWEVKEANKVLLKSAFKGASGTVSPLAAPPWLFDFAKKGHPQALFFDVMKLSTGKVGKSGMPSVDDEWQQANASNPLVQQYMDWSLYRKMYDSFAAKMFLRVSPSGNDEDCHTDSRIRADFNLTRVVTGRISCSNPNLQQIPRAENEAKKSIKNIFQAPPGMVMVQLDYKANEIRWVGILSGDENLADALKRGKRVIDEYRTNPSKELLTRAELYGDIHKQMASMIFDKPIEKVEKIERQAAKACLEKGTLTITSKGFKKIEDVVVGDEVWTGEQWTPVLDLYRTTSKIFKIRAKCGWEIGVSEDHEIMAYDTEAMVKKFTFVKDLISGRHVIPRYQKEIKTSEMTTATACDVIYNYEIPNNVLLSSSDSHEAYLNQFMGFGVISSQSEKFIRQASILLWNLGRANSVSFDGSLWTLIEKPLDIGAMRGFEVTEVIETDRTEEVYDVVLNPEHPWFVAGGASNWDCQFGILYDSSMESIAEKFNKSLEEVETWFTKFFSRFPAIAAWKAEMKQMAQDQGFVETPHGRRRRLPVFDLYRGADGRFSMYAVPAEARSQIGKALRVASNAPIQGIASDAGMIGAALFAEFIRSNERKWEVVNAVHDSCLYLVPYDELEESLEVAERLFTERLQEYMTEHFGIEFPLPLEVEFEIGIKWGDLEKWNFNLAELEEIKKDILAEWENQK